MIEILPVVDYAVIQENLQKHPVDAKQPILLSVTEQGKTLGGVFFTLGDPKSEEAELLDVWTELPNDLWLVDGIVRAAASFLYERGKKIISCQNASLKESLLSVGFYENDKKVLAQLPQLFQRCKK